jgi:ATP-dependent helicase/nuclease subunit B
MPITRHVGRAKPSTKSSKNGCSTTSVNRTSFAAALSGFLPRKRFTRCCARWLLEAIDWIAAMERENQAAGRRPLTAEAKGETVLGGVTVHGRVDRIDRLADGALAIIDYKTGAPPTQKAVNAGFALQLGLLGLIGRAGGFEGVSGDPDAFEYWSLQRYRGTFGRLMCPDKDMAPGEFLDVAYRNFVEAAQKWLTGDEPFTAKLNPAYAPYGDYDQLMRLEEWYGR